MDCSSLHHGYPTIFRLQNLDTGGSRVSNLRLEVPALAEAANEYDRCDVISRHGDLLADEADDVLHDWVEYSRSHLLLWNREAVTFQAEALIDPYGEGFTLWREILFELVQLVRVVFDGQHGRRTDSNSFRATTSRSSVQYLSP